ncbi:flavoprotein [Thozetella sp. PMI_491]|nr:flavoprotein [Thozetella sp. PMI_491]
MSVAKSIAIITASTRKPRVGPDVAKYVKNILDQEPLSTPAGTPVTLAEVDLATFNLPVLDEPMPGRNTTSEDHPHEHSRAWSREIKKHDAYVLVTPEYNYTIAGGVKNAIDYLLHEWTGKPVAIVTYGIAGGTFASEHTKHVLSMMKLRVAETLPQLDFGGSFGPEAGSAAGGKLSEESSKRWDEVKKADIQKAFAEVRELLDQEPPAAASA